MLLDLIVGPMQYGFMQRGLVATILVGVVCAVVGSFVVLRGLAFIGDAVSHAAFPGLVIAYLLGLPLYLGATVTAVGTALGIAVISRRGGLRFDTAVGVVFAGMFALGIALFSAIDGYVVDLFGYLLGNVLGITAADIAQIAVLGAVVLAIVWVLRKELLYASFDRDAAAASGLPVDRLDALLLVLIGVTIVVSIQAVGIIMVVAMLVTPAATGQLLARRFWDLVRIAVAISVVATISGLYLSYYLDVASGASIVLVESAIFVVTLLATTRRRSLAPGVGGMTGPAPDDYQVAFAGLQRNARALFVGGLLIALIVWVLPDLTPPPTQAPAVSLFRGEIVEFLHSDDVTAPDVRLKITAGPRAGDVIDGYLQGPSGSEELPRYDIGDDVIISGSLEPGDTFWAVSDLYRVPVLALLLAIFAVAVTVVGGWRGVRSLLALGLTLVVIVRIVVPLILAGNDPLWVAIVAATSVTLVTFLLTEGANRQTLAAAIGTFVALALVAVIAMVFDELARFTTLRGSEDAAYLQAIGLGPIDIGGLILAAIIFGALGILDDVTVTQAATVTELHEADPYASRRVVAGRAMNVGRSHIAATVNTLVLAYVGASLPLIVLFAAGRQDPFLTASSEIVAVEVVRALAGSIGIVAAVPLTTAIAAALIGRRIPFVSSGRQDHAPGWD